MSKEMLVIALGLLVIAVRTVLGVPGPWQTALLVASGLGIAVLGFLLRGESIGRSSARPARPERGSAYTFVESQPEPAAATAHEHKEGITSLN
jgi:hypothetical protein